MLLLLLIAALCTAREARAQETEVFPPFEPPLDTVTFVHGDVRLWGAFMKPAGPGPFPAVVIAHGAGPAVHDEPAFRLHANAFIHRGFAVLVYDKRGSGHSTGDLDISDYDDLAGDVLAGVQLLRSRRDIVPTKIGVLGRSEGAWVGAIAAQRDPSLAFVIMSSGSGVRPYDEALFWTRSALRAHGAPDSVAAKALHMKAAIWAYYRRVAEDTVAGKNAASLADCNDLKVQLRAYSNYRPEVPGIACPDKNPMAFFRAFTNMIYYDPAHTFNALRTPVLELLGAQDDVVEPASSVAVFERLRAAGHDATVRVFPGVGHSLSLTLPDGRHRYPSDYLDFLTEWARTRVDRVPGPR